MSAEYSIVLPDDVEACSCDESRHLRCILAALAMYYSGEALMVDRELFYLLSANPDLVYASLVELPL